MRTYMETSCETSWSNRVTMRIESDLDNADPLTAAAMFETMALRLHSMTEEVREANERALVAAGFKVKPKDEPMRGEEEPSP